MDIENLLFKLSGAYAAGTLNSASQTAFEELSKYTECKLCGKEVIGKMNGESDYTLMLDAHIDEVSMVVTDVDENGFVTVAKCGGIDIRTLPAKRVVIHGKKTVPAVFCSTPPHLSSGETEYDDISKIKLDTLMGKSARDFISVGDYVTYCTQPQHLSGSRITGKSLDDRAGVVCLLELAKRLYGKKLPFNVTFVLSDAEELGLRGSRTATYLVNPDESVAVDVSFATAPDVSKNEGGEMSKGAMIGISPVLDCAVSEKLIKIAQENKIPYQTEIMGSSTGTNADVISVSRCGVRSGLVSIPLRNMHTDNEIVDICDIVSVCDILEKYILGGGVKNA